MPLPLAKPDANEVVLVAGRDPLDPGWWLYVVERAGDGPGLSEVARLDLARPLIDRVLPFTDLPAAFARLVSGEARGRVCLTRSGA
jgi:hypothetical protein